MNSDQNQQTGGIDKAGLSRMLAGAALAMTLILLTPAKPSAASTASEHTQDAAYYQTMLQAILADSSEDKNLGACLQSVKMAKANPNQIDPTWLAKLQTICTKVYSLSVAHARIQAPPAFKKGEATYKKSMGEIEDAVQHLPGAFSAVSSASVTKYGQEFVHGEHVEENALDEMKAESKTAP
jgi:hypothetical protein